ncbi:hypothetical protein QUF70_14475 [Desulfobacterales bacterium HSG17]|nr:hypothetical protein [Desulfobacterales bacterium HSG17]
MSQCKKMINTKEQCSNRAIPGTEYCKQHKKRIKFRKISKPVISESEPDPKPDKKELQNQKARPSAPGQAPSFPDLRPDKRNILVAPQGIILLTGTDNEDEHKTGTLFDRLISILACLSMEISLSAHVSISNIKNKTYIILITPPNPKADDLSSFYDTVLSASELTDSILFIGKDRAFIRYRDESAPRGYDIPDAKLPDGPDILLTDINGTHVISPDIMNELSLDELLLSIPPHPKQAKTLSETVYVLTQPPLYAMLSHYFRAHHLRFHVASFSTEKGKNYILFQISPRPDAPAGSFVPGFVMSYLKSLPRCAILTETEAQEDCKILIEWGYKYPCQNIPDVFPEKSLLLFTPGPDFKNMCLSPAPAFFNGDKLINLQTPNTAKHNMACPIISPENQAEMPLEIPVRLIPEPGISPFPAALILDKREMDWLGRLVRQMPENNLHKYHLCQGQDYAVLMGNQFPIKGIPFGIPLRSVKDTRLFIPLCSRLTPELPWEILSELMEIAQETCAFLTDSLRLDIPAKEFTPLTRALVAETQRPCTAFKIQPVSGLPRLKWTLRPQSKENSENQKGIFRKMLERNQKDPKNTKPEKPETSLQHHAQQYQKHGDHLSAGICYALINDPDKAAQCYKTAASETGS